jgi:CheY-like chemotaxis protein
VNALDALGWPVARGELRVSARHAARRVEVVVEDDAAAIPASALAGLFDPRPPVDAGRSPLDLAVARHLLRGAGGDLRAEIGEGRGNRFVLELPVAPAADAVDAVAGMDPDARDPTRPNADRPHGTAQVLVCDDDDSIRSLIVRVLRHDGLEAIGAATGEAALSLLAERPVGLVIADHHLGTTSGLDLYRRAVELRPALRGRFILVSGDAGDAGLVAFAHEHAVPVVEKPFDVTDIARLARELTAG